MFGLTDITATFQKASDAFNPISSKPNNGDLQSLNEVLVFCCLVITLTRTSAASPSRVVLSIFIYKANDGGASFNFMCNAHADYDPAIKLLSKDDCVSMMRGLNHNWAAGTANQSRIRAI